MNEALHHYLRSLVPSADDWVKKMQETAHINSVPIMEPVSMEFLLQLIRLKKPARILEIGTAIGYSALRMLDACPTSHIVTIERDKTRYDQAVEFIAKRNKTEQITTVYGDALEKIHDLTVSQEVFDCVFIDAAKGQYQRFFELASPLLQKGGMIISDNVLFRGQVVEPEIAQPRHQPMVKKLRNYNEWLAHHPDYVTTIVPIGDGVAISVKIR
ncbi:MULTISPECIES: O-methyltransferase [unclassified Virgibacillus]|uniref:O-methyltransferase n=1 Tax=unclassified Virgibacillus TaxID=2620237 RepID=UPI0024DEBCA6|nr:O-methyltransferase [Virgibacillus sp. LDC-1]